jgi:SAM-dependent methyltransferase
MRLLDPHRMETCTVAVGEDVLIETQRAFDGVAASYDRSNAENRTLCEMRRRALAAVLANVPAGSHILDLGCGPGSDDEELARRGYDVTAIDWSPAMVAEARQRVRQLAVDSRVQVHHLGIHEVHRLAPAVFDAAYSNFGPLNCVSNLPHAARLIADRLRPGGVLVASVIGRVCPWEIAIYLAKGNWRRVQIRFAADLVAVPLDGRTVWMRYHTPRSFARAFEAVGFSRVSLRTLGLFAPPPYVQGFAARHPSLVATLQRIDDAVGHWPVLRGWGDHFLVVLRKS